MKDDDDDHSSTTNEHDYGRTKGEVANRERISSFCLLCPLARYLNSTWGFATEP